MAAGTSYYKTAAPPEVVIEGESLSPSELDLYHHLYDDGLREFAVSNGLPVPRTVGLLAGRGVAGHAVPPEGGSAPACWCRSAAVRTRWSSSKRCASWARGCSPSIRTPW